MKVVNTKTGLDESWMFGTKNKEIHPSLYVVIEENNPAIPSSKLFRVRFGAKDKAEADSLIRQFKREMPDNIKEDLRIRIEQA